MAGSASAWSDVVQMTNYYPFGAPYADADAATGSAIPQYKYNGKELDVTHGLNTYDYGARQLDPILGRWDRMDPLAEKYPPLRRICNLAELSIRTCSPEKGALQMPIFIGSGLQIQTNGSCEDVCQDGVCIFKLFPLLQ